MRLLGFALLLLGGGMLILPAALLVWAWSMYSVGVSIRTPVFALLWIALGLGAGVAGVVILRRAAKARQGSDLHAKS